MHSTNARALDVLQQHGQSSAQVELEVSSNLAHTDEMARNTIQVNIAVKYFLIQEMVAEHTCIVIRCDTNKNLADIFTKALPPQKHIEMASYFFTGTSPIDVSAQIK